MDASWILVPCRLPHAEALVEVDEKVLAHAGSAKVMTCALKTEAVVHKQEALAEMFKITKSSHTGLQLVKNKWSLICFKLTEAVPAEDGDAQVRPLDQVALHRGQQAQHEAVRDAVGRDGWRYS